MHVSSGVAPDAARMIGPAHFKTVSRCHVTAMQRIVSGGAHVCGYSTVASVRCPTLFLAIEVRCALHVADIEAQSERRVHGVLRHVLANGSASFKSHPNHAHTFGPNPADRAIPHTKDLQSILDDGPPLRHELHLPALLPQPVLKATSSTIVTRSCPPDAINAGRSLKWCSEPCAT